MSTAAVIAQDPIELRKAGLRALNDALGQDAAQAFLRQYSGTGNFTEDRHKWNPKTHEEVAAGIMKMQDDMASGAVDIAGRPIGGAVGTAKAS
jgi:hypothetical protein